MSACVCIIEDDPDLRELLCALCNTQGLRVKAYDSAEAFWNNYDRVDIACLVLDLHLPGMSGVDLLARLNAAGSYLPVIVMSGSAERTLVIDALKLGAADFFGKPFDIYALLRRIQEFAQPVAWEPHPSQPGKPNLLPKAWSEAAASERPA